MKTENLDSVIKGGLFLFPLAIFAGVLYLKAYHHKVFRWVIQEDGIIEYWTSVNYAFAFILAVAMVAMMAKSEQRVMAIMYGILGLFFLFCAGEEISWGQRILHIPTPDFFREHSFQYEINLHNLRIIRDFDYFFAAKVSIAIGLYGSLSALVALGLRYFGWPWLHKQMIPYFAPRLYQTSYFLLTAVYSFYDAFLFPKFRILNIRHKEQEVIELVLSLGFLIFIIHNFLEFRRRRKPIGVEPISGSE